jgi:hypothetical protein
MAEIWRQSSSYAGAPTIVEATASGGIVESSEIDFIEG